MRKNSLPVMAGIALTPLLLFVACESTQSPTMCMFTAAELADAGSDAQPDDFPCPDPADAGESEDASAAVRCTVVSDGEVFFVRHKLPEGVTAQGPLALRIRTPCGESKVDVPYVGGVALLSQTAPRGAGCALTVEAVLANSELRCSVSAAPASACANICDTDGGP